MPAVSSTAQLAVSVSGLIVVVDRITLIGTQFESANDQSRDSTGTRISKDSMKLKILALRCMDMMDIRSKWITREARDEKQ